MKICNFGEGNYLHEKSMVAV